MSVEQKIDKLGADWEAHIRLDVCPPRLVMRRKISDPWEYREPTGKEYEDYMSAEAW